LIDDVWSTAAWDVIRSKLPGSNWGSRIIVTTRIDTVAKACSTPDGNGYYIHHMKKLGEKTPRSCSSAEHLALLETLTPRRWV